MLASAMTIHPLAYRLVWRWFQPLFVPLSRKYDLKSARQCLSVVVREGRGAVFSLFEALL